MLLMLCQWSLPLGQLVTSHPGKINWLFWSNQCYIFWRPQSQHSNVRFRFPCWSKLYGCNEFCSQWQARFKYLKSTVSCNTGNQEDCCHGKHHLAPQYPERERRDDFLRRSPISALHQPWQPRVLCDAETILTILLDSVSVLVLCFWGPCYI